MAIEKEKLIQQMNELIIHSQEFNHSVDCTNLIESSLRAKQYFINLFDGELIYEYPEEVSFELSKNDKKNRVLDFCGKIENKFGEYELSEFIYQQLDYFFENRVGTKYIKQDGTIIPEGMKLLKAFKYFETNEDTLEKLQNMASMIIQEDKITGTLCFSVHPLDFMSSSENNHKWRSCHALDGEYRAGNLSYMLDSTTFMVYLRSEKLTVLPNFPNTIRWNNKKWRCLLFLNDKRDMMFAGRQYPFTSIDGLEYVKNVLTNNISKFGNWTEWQNDKIRTFNFGGAENPGLHSPYVGVGRKLKSMKQIIQDSPHPLHFNDLLKSTCYDPVYCYKIDIKPSLWFNEMRKTLVTHEDGVFKVGNTVTCPCCNKNLIELPESLVCTDCDLEYGTALSDSFGICDCCGRRYYYDDGYYIDLTEQDVCSTCFETYYGCCVRCGDTGYLGEDIFYDNVSGECFCKYCIGED